MKNHIFSKVKNFKGKNLLKSIKNSNVSNDKYLKLYKIDSNLVDYNVDTLENSINYTHSNNILANAKIFETLKEVNDEFS